MIKPLINGQRIIIDRHRRGTNEPNVWDKDVHIDKRFNGNNKQYADATIKVPLVGNTKPSFEVNGYSDEILRRRIVKEINKALKDGAKLKSFVGDVIESIKNF